MNQQNLNRARPIKNFYDCPSSEAYSSLTVWRYVFVADFEALSYHNTRKFIRCRNAEIRTISAIKYTACYALAILVTVMVNRVIHFDDGLFFTVYIQILYSKMG